MSPVINISIYLTVGLVGGFLGLWSRLPAGTMLGAVLAVICFKLYMSGSWETPQSYGFFCQVLLGVLIALTYTPGMFKALGDLLLPMVLTTVLLMICGVFIALIIAKFWHLDLRTAYIATSPGGMSALVPMSADIKVNTALIACFHFFRIFLVVFTAPFIFKLIFK